MKRQYLLWLFLVFCGLAPPALHAQTDAALRQAVTDDIPLTRPVGKAIHWVLLIDTSAHASAPQFAVAFERATNALWESHVIQRGDWISAVPYQRTVDTSWTEGHWRRPVVRYSDVQSVLPPQTQMPGNGHDPERAVRDTLLRLESRREDVGGAVLLMMARSYIGEKPTGDPAASILDPNDSELVRLLSAAKMKAVSFPLDAGGTLIQARRYVPEPLIGTAPAPLPWPAWVMPLAIVVSLAIIVVVLLILFRKRLFPGPHRARLTVDLGGSNYGNKPFPSSGRLFLMAKDGTLREGSKTDPAEWPLVHVSSPTGGGRLLTIDASNRRNIRLEAGICSPNITEMTYGVAKDVILTPDKSTGAMAFTVRLTVTKTKNS